LIACALTASQALAQEVGSKKVCDASNFCWSVYEDGESGSTFGIALPSNVTDPFDVVLKITSPLKNTWTGFAWGGTMVWNPLSVTWANGNSAMPSSRFAL
jgi:hypothetical protein